MIQENELPKKDGCKPSSPVNYSAISLSSCCKNCGQSLKRLMLLALIEDAGAKCYPNALYCSPGHEHNF